MAGKQKATSGEPNTTRKKRVASDLAVIPGWTPKHRGPLPPHVPTDATRMQVELMTSYGASQPQIAAVLDINPSTLARHYREQLTLGHMRANMAVAQNLYRIATTQKPTAPVVNAAVWWTKARMGWSEIRRTQADVRTISGNMRDLTDDQLIQIIEGAGIRESEQGALPAPSEPGEPG
jgi:hypothetical protein